MYILSVISLECQFQPLPHAKNRMIERGISRIEILDAINKGAKRLDGRKIIAFHRGIEVVYKKKPCHIFVITTFRG